MSIENVSEGLGSFPIGRAYLDAKKRVEKTDQVEKKSKPDEVNISSDAKRLMQRDSLIEQVKVALDELPDIRESRVKQTQDRLNFGYYADENVQKQIAGSLFEDQETLPSEVASLKEEAVYAEQHLEKLHEIGQRVVEGFYDRIEVIESLAEKLMG